MAFGIEIDYNEVRAVAREFDARSADTERLISEARKRVTTLLGEWDGIASDEFDAQAQSCLARMTRIPGMLQSIAAELRYAADEIQAAEARAKAAFEAQQRLALP